MHELDPDYLMPPQLGDPGQEADLKRWRKAERERLTGLRMALRVACREAHDARLIGHLEAAIGPVAGRVVSAYWPFRAEPDLRPLFRAIVAGGGRCALPVVVAKGQPLVFRAWAPGEELVPGVWKIPVPVETAAAVVPDVVIAPVIGFDAACYRLGYGGGFFDRTLAAMRAAAGAAARRPRVLGVGYELAAIPTIYPQWHDIPMDLVITEAGVTRPARP
jgi:5,10-methenyltetrahydrofolate synthetase